MANYTFSNDLHAIYHKAFEQYKTDQRDVSTLFSDPERAFLAAHGLTAQALYDYVEDEANYGEPGWNNALSIELVRRDYFLNKQAGKPSAAVLDVNQMPAKTDAVRGIEWLPRLIPKAKAKLRGELPPSLMYNCGGDRRFFKQHDINPAEFLRAVWAHESDDEAIIDWVIKRKA